MIDTNSKIFIQAVTAAKAAVTESGHYLKKQFKLQNHQISLDGTHEKIKDDEIAENIILDALKKKLSNFSYISEETHLHSNDEIQFIIDPIERTSNYARGVSFFATQIAVMYQNTLAVSFIYEPIKDIMYHAVLGQGAYANKTKLNCNTNKPLNNSTLSGGAGSSPKHKLALLQRLEKLTSQSRTVRMFGSAGLELAYVAQGKFSAHINLGSKVYDYAAGVLLVREAGGRAISIEGEDWELTDSTLVGCSKKYENEILSLLK